MPQKIRMWEVTKANTLTELASTEITLEARLEDWLENDISMIDQDLLVIGRQVRTDFGGEIDLLCLDSAGDTVIIELKKGKTPRDVTAQTLDYASWVRDLGIEQIEEIASHYGKLEGPLDVVFEEKFRSPLPDTLNVNHRSLIVAEAMDASTERIVRYLAGLNVPINVTNVQHFKSADEREMLAQVHLVEPEATPVKESSKSKRRYNRSIIVLLDQADANGIGPLFRRVREKVRWFLDAVVYEDRVWYRWRTTDGSTPTVLIVRAIPADDDGGLRFVVHATRLKAHRDISLEDLKSLLPASTQETDSVRTWPSSSEEEKANGIGLEGTFHTSEEIDKFIDGLRGSKVPSPTESL